MRVTQASEQTQFLANLDSLESNISTTQNQISTGDAYTTPSQDPAAAGLVDNYQQVLAQSQQFTSNANSAQTDLNTEDTALTNVTSQLQSLRDLALQAESGTVSNQNLSSIATQMQQIQNSLLSLANTQDGNGNYIFAGYSSQTQPFTLTSTGASYAGDQGTRQIQVATGQTVAAGDNGDAVFNTIPTGNGTFTVTANAANAGTGLIGATTVTTPSAVTGDSYSIDFTGVATDDSSTYNVVDTTTGVTLTTGAAYTSGQAITVGGQQVTLSGTPKTGDSFAIAPSTKQSIFTTVQSLITTLQAGVSTTNGQTALANSITGAINNLDQALNQTSTVQASVGGRLNTVTTALSLATSQQAQLTTSISNLQGLDYPAAITSLESQNTTLSAAMQAFTLTQGLTLFKYIS
jgi:flagellar hook-associated protein 3 FlgL